MRRSYARTLWTYLQLLEIERIDELKERGKQINIAGLMAIAFAEPKKLADEHHRWMTDIGMTASPDEVLDRAQSVIAVMARVHAGILPTTTSPDGIAGDGEAS